MAESLGEKLTASISVLTLGAGLLALFLGVNNWWAIFVFGWLVATPLADILFDDEGDATRQSHDRSEEDTQDALDTLRERYAGGELTEEQFERKVERLLETETVEDARDRVAGGADRSRERTGQQEGAAERERAEPDREPEREPERES